MYARGGLGGGGQRHGAGGLVGGRGGGQVRIALRVRVKCKVGAGLLPAVRARVDSRVWVAAFRIDSDCRRALNQQNTLSIHISRCILAVRIRSVVSAMLAAQHMCFNSCLSLLAAA